MEFRIAHVITRFNRGGTTSWITDLSKELISRGHSITIYCGPTEYPEVKNITLSGFNSRFIKALSKSVNPLSIIKSILSIRKFVRLDSISILISHTSHAGIIAKLSVTSIPKSRRPLLIHTYHGHFLEGYFKSIGLALYKLTERGTRNLADGFVVSGHKVYESLVSSGILKISTPVCLANPPISRVFQGPPRLTESASLTVGWLARIAPIKRFDRLVELANRFPGCSFLVGGDFEMSSREFTQLPANLKMLGWIDSANFWPRCNIALCTSDNEAQPLSLLEAAAHGIPALTTNVGSCSDAVLHLETGIVVEPTIDHLTQGLQDYVDRPALVEKFGRQAQIRIERDYTAEHCALTHEQFFYSLLKLPRV